MTSSDAWLLKCSDSLSIAVADHEMVEYVQAPIRFAVPGSPEYCSSVLLWQENLVPVMDIAVQPGHSAVEMKTLMSIVAYQQQPGAPLQHLAISVTSVPEKIRVDDEQACELPEELNTSVLMPVTLLCFTHNARPVLVLDIAGLCSDKFRDAANAA